MARYIFNFKALLFTILLVLSSSAQSQIQTGIIKRAYCVDGIWGNWVDKYASLHITQAKDGTFCITHVDALSNHPSVFNWRLTFNINNYSTDNSWTVHEGTFEYYLSSDVTDIKNLMAYDLNWVSPSSDGAYKRVVPATVKLQKRLKDVKYYSGKTNFFGMPRRETTTQTEYIFNIWFDNVGLGVQLN